MPAFETLNFVQSLPFGRTLRFEVEGNRDVHMHYKSLFKTQSQSFPLDLISPRPGINKTINLAAGIAALVLLLIIGFCLIGYSQNPERFSQPLMVLTLLFLPPALVALWFFNASFTPALVFFRSDDGDELFKIRQFPKDKVALEHFAKALTDRIESIRYPGTLSHAEQVELYQKHLDFLLGENVLTQSEYDVALARLEKRRSGGNIFKLI